jgi:uncharacterized protein YbbK (DUF523 family)
MNDDRIRIGISACLLGEEVRYNGGHTTARRPVCSTPFLPTRVR